MNCCLVCACVFAHPSLRGEPWWGDKSFRQIYRQQRTETFTLTLTRFLFSPFSVKLLIYADGCNRLLDVLLLFCVVFLYASGPTLLTILSVSECDRRSGLVVFSALFYWINITGGARLRMAAPNAAAERSGRTEVWRV